MPNTITGPATVNIFTAVPVTTPSARKSMAGEATALAKPVMGTSVASAIMRLAMYEIMYMPDIPHGVAINEAVELTRKYDEPETAKFVNGILGSFLRQEIKE